MGESRDRGDRTYKRRTSRGRVASRKSRNNRGGRDKAWRTIMYNSGCEYNTHTHTYIYLYTVLYMLRSLIKNTGAGLSFLRGRENFDGEPAYRFYRSERVNRYYTYIIISRIMRREPNGSHFLPAKFLNNRRIHYKYQ